MINRIIKNRKYYSKNLTVCLFNHPDYERGIFFVVPCYNIQNITFKNTYTTASLSHVINLVPEMVLKCFINIFSILG